MSSSSISQHERHGVWVPAFAGTTPMLGRHRVIAAIATHHPLTPRLTVSETARTSGLDWPNKPFNTISCINFRDLPQVLGRRRPIWYPASAAFDRHT